MRNASGRPSNGSNWCAGWCNGCVRCDGCVSCNGCADTRERAHRLSAVADGCFLVVRHFAERLAVIRIPENRIVAEAVRPGRLPREQSFHLRGCFEQHVAVVRNRERADKSRRAIAGCAFAHASIDMGEAFVVGGIFAQISRRINAGLPVQRVHFEPRIFRHRHHAGDAGIVQRLLPRVLGERRTCLFCDACSREIGERLER